MGSFISFILHDSAFQGIGSLCGLTDPKRNDFTMWDNRFYISFSRNHFEAHKNKSKYLLSHRIWIIRYSHILCFSFILSYKAQFMEKNCCSYWYVSYCQDSTRFNCDILQLTIQLLFGLKCGISQFNAVSRISLWSQCVRGYTYILYLMRRLLIFAAIIIIIILTLTTVGIVGHKQMRTVSRKITKWLNCWTAKNYKN